MDEQTNQAQEHALPGISNLADIITLVKALESLQNLGPDFAALVALATEAKGLVTQLVALEQQAQTIIGKDITTFVAELPKAGSGSTTPAA